jgi:hypothetical protein
VSYSMKDNPFGETTYQCVIFKRIAKITEGFHHIEVEFPFGDHPKRKFDKLSDFEYYLDGGD